MLPELLEKTSLFQMVWVSSSLYADFGSSGLYRYENTTWTSVAPVDAGLMAGGASELFVSFPGYGLYGYKGFAWSLLTTMEGRSK